MVLRRVVSRCGAEIGCKGDWRQQHRAGHQRAIPHTLFLVPICYMVLDDLTKLVKDMLKAFGMKQTPHPAEGA